MSQGGKIDSDRSMDADADHDGLQPVRRKGKNSCHEDRKIEIIRGARF